MVIITSAEMAKLIFRAMEIREASYIPDIGYKLTCSEATALACEELGQKTWEDLVSCLLICGWNDVNDWVERNQ